MINESDQIQWGYIKNRTIKYKEKPSKRRHRNELKKFWMKINYNL